MNDKKKYRTEMIRKFIDQAVNWMPLQNERQTAMEIGANQRAEDRIRAHDTARGKACEDNDL